MQNIGSLKVSSFIKCNTLSHRYIYIKKNKRHQCGNLSTAGVDEVNRTDRLEADTFIYINNPQINYNKFIQAKVGPDDASIKHTEDTSCECLQYILSPRVFDNVLIMH